MAAADTLDDIFSKLDAIVRPDFSPLVNAPDFPSALDAVRDLLKEHYASGFPAGLENCFYPALKACNPFAVEAVFYAAKKVAEAPAWSSDIHTTLKERWRSWILGQSLGGMLDTYLKVHHDGNPAGLWTHPHPDGRHALHSWMWMAPKAFDEALQALRAQGLPPVEVRLELLKDLKENDYRAGDQMTGIVKALAIEECADAVDPWLDQLEEIEPVASCVDLAILLCRPEHAFWKKDSTWSNAMIHREGFPQATSHLVRTLNDTQFEKLEKMWGRMGKAEDFKPFAQERLAHTAGVVHEQLNERTLDPTQAVRPRRI